MPIYSALNLPLINEFSRDDGWESVWDRIGAYLAMAGLPERTIPLAAERAIARQEALAREQEKRDSEQRAALERWREQQAATRQAPQAQQVDRPKWGTAAARRMEIERIRRENEERRKR